MAHRGYTADPNSDGRRSSSEYGTLHVTPTERGYESDPNAETLSSVDLSYKRQADKWAYTQDYDVLDVKASERGYESDPNAEILSSEDPTYKRPVNRWVYYQDYETLQQRLPASGDIGDLFDKEFSFKCPITLGCVEVDGGFLTISGLPDYEACDSAEECCEIDNVIYTFGKIPYVGPEFVDGGVVGKGPLVDHTFASVKVIDGSEPISPPSEADVDLGDLAIDSDGQPALQAFIVNPSTLDVYDGFLISSSLPRPINWDGGLFSEWNTGVNIDGLVYRILGEDPNKVQELEVFRYVVFEDGSLVECDGFDQQTFLEVSREFGYATQFNPGDILGRINYEVIECVAVITDWSHYNWDDDTPIRKAFRALIKNLPSTVSNIYVPVVESGNSQLKTSPDRALWTALGFVPISDSPMMLIYSPDDNIVPY